jgi:hypothetical protein
MPSRQLVYAVSVMWQHVSLSKGHRQDVGIIYIRGNVYSFMLKITYAAPVWSSTSLTSYRHLQVYQSKCLRVMGDFPRRTPISNLHAYLQIIPIRQFIYHLTDKFFVSCPVHPNLLIRNTGNYTLEDLHRHYTKYRHKRIKYILL